MTVQAQTALPADADSGPFTTGPFTAKPDQTELRLAFQMSVVQPVAPHHTEQQQKALEDLAAGRGTWRLETYEWLKGDAAALEAFRRILLHVDCFMDVRGKRRVHQDCRYSKLVHGLATLAYHHRHWRRPLEAWIGTITKGGQPRVSDQFSALARHLLAIYEVPNFIDAAWFEGLEAYGVQQQEWFIHSCYAAPLYLVIDLVRRIQDIGVKQVIS
jgi:hypothetical protein